VPVVVTVDRSPLDTGVAWAAAGQGIAAIRLNDSRLLIGSFSTRELGQFDILEETTSIEFTDIAMGWFGMAAIDTSGKLWIYGDGSRRYSVLSWRPVTEPVGSR
jgi:hypothetical protein